MDAERGVERDLEVPLPGVRRVFVRLEDLPSTDTTPGRRTRYKGPSARLLRLTRAFDAADEMGRADLLGEIAAAMLPDLTDAECEALSADTVFRLLDMGRKTIAELEAIAKNAEPPLVEAAKGSNSQTPSPTRSRKSPRATAKTSTP